MTTNSPQVLDSVVTSVRQHGGLVGLQHSVLARDILRPRNVSVFVHTAGNTDARLLVGVSTALAVYSLYRVSVYKGCMALGNVDWNSP